MQLLVKYTRAGRVRHSYSTSYCTDFGASCNVGPSFGCVFLLFVILNIIFLQARGNFESIFMSFAWLHYDSLLNPLNAELNPICHLLVL
jgi:hypothetical protein